MTKIEKEKAFESKQLPKLLKLQKKKRSKLYYILIIVLILLVDILDNFCTNTPTNIQSNIIQTFLITGYGLDELSAYSLHSGIGIVAYIMGLLNPFYKALGDKYGRKPLFFISTIGMTFGLSTILLCNSYIVFMIGTCITTFFLGNDIQILYILEEAPSKHRAKIYSIVKSLGGFSSISVPLLRTFILNEDGTNWQKLYLLPAVSGVLIAILVFFFARETEVFVDERIEYLNIPYEERLKNEENKKEKNKNQGIIYAIKYIFKDKQLKNLLFIKCIFDIGILAVQSYNSIIRFDFGYSENEITIFEYCFPLLYSLSVIVSGILADSIGRKKTIFIFGTITLITFILFIIFGSIHMHPIYVGVMYGLYLGGYWIGRDYMEIMATEMVPTEIRASIIGAFSLLVYSGMAIGYLLNSILPTILGSIWLSSLIIIAPSVLISIILLLFKIKETKGVDYESIK